MVRDAFHLIWVLVPVSFPCSVNVPLQPVRLQQTMACSTPITLHTARDRDKDWDGHNRKQWFPVHVDLCTVPSVTIETHGSQFRSRAVSMSHICQISHIYYWVPLTMIQVNISTSTWVTTSKYQKGTLLIDMFKKFSCKEYYPKRTHFYEFQLLEFCKRDPV